MVTGTNWELKVARASAPAAAVVSNDAGDGEHLPDELSRHVILPGDEPRNEPARCARPRKAAWMEVRSGKS